MQHIVAIVILLIAIPLSAMGSFPIWWTIFLAVLLGMNIYAGILRLVREG